jgi:histidine triad (HIT) family protein
MTNCIFCRIVSGRVPSKTVYKDEVVTAFHDVNPQAPTHILVVPNKHIAGAGALEPDHASIVAAMFMAAKLIAQTEGLSARGYRLVINEGSSAGQSVYHLHLHILGGRTFDWPPG